MTKRHRLTKAERVAVFRDADAVCHLCGGKINVGDLWDVSHPIPLELGGADDKSNWRPAHKHCHREETKTDVSNIAKAKRREAKHIGIKRDPARKLQSRGFSHKPRREKLPLPPKRSLYESKK